jgi:hypothetical protein
MTWYFEQATFDGRWTPCTSENQPTEKRADGTSVRIRPDSIREINRGHEGLTLDQLFERYSQDGRFRNI